MTAKRLLLPLLLLLVSFSVDAKAETVIVKTKNNGDINSIAASLGGTVLDALDDGSTYLLSVPSVPNTLPEGCESLTVDALMVLPRFRGVAVNTSNSGAQWYVNQPAFQLIQAAAARSKSTGRGVIIADIDSAIDASQVAVRGHLTAGYDFVKDHGNGNGNGNGSLNQSTASFLDQSTASFLDQSTASFLDQSTASFLDQSTASFLDQSTASFLESNSPGHGHGTMVAGILAALAPDALIMPLRAFDDNGVGHAFQVAKAIRYAAKNGAHVINLSLGLGDDSKDVRAAIDFAIKRNVVVVASAGNSNSSQAQFPAALPNVIGVAASDIYDHKAAFSNYGSSVFVTAPGVAIITAYPNGYAVASGTSFSSPIVAAEAALIRSLSVNGGVPARLRRVRQHRFAEFVVCGTTRLRPSRSVSRGLFCGAMKNVSNMFRVTVGRECQRNLQAP